jgi:hypothetical protein
MRLRQAAVLSLGLAASIVPLEAALAEAAAGHPPAVPRPAPAFAAASAPACGNASAHAFPITARLRGGPATYRAGGGTGTWYVDLTNTTGHACRNVHPVLVVSGSGHRLKAVQITLRLAGKRGALRALPLHTSDEDEIIGVNDKDTTGLTVPAHGTVSLGAALAFSRGAPSGVVTVSAAVVQREGGDGDWVGESKPYRLTVVDGRAAGERESGRDGSGTGDGDGVRDGSGTGDATGDGRTDRPDGTDSTRRPGGTASATGGTASAGRTPAGEQSDGHRPAPSDVAGAATGAGEPTPGAEPEAESDPGPEPEPKDDAERKDDTGRKPGRKQPPGPTSEPPASSPSSVPSAPGFSVPSDSSPSPSSSLSTEAVPEPEIPQLAATGTAGVVARTALSVGLIAAGAGIVVLVERRRTRRP